MNRLADRGLCFILSSLGRLSIASALTKFRHTMVVVVAATMHQPYQWLLHGGFWFYDLPDGYGFGLWGVYLMWLVVIVILYAPCWWFARLKERSKNPLLSYL